LGLQETRVDFESNHPQLLSIFTACAAADHKIARALAETVPARAEKVCARRHS
jgi:hypothetical protein